MKHELYNFSCARGAGSHARVKRTLGGSHSSKAALLPSAASEVIEISDSDDEGKPGGTRYISVTSFGKKTRKRRVVELYSSCSESD